MGRLLNMHPDSEVEPALPPHLAHIEQEGQRPRSISERRLIVLRVARWLGHPLATATREEIEAWRETIRFRRDNGQPRKPSGIAVDLAHISSYLQWLAQTERRPDDASRWLVRPKRIYHGDPHPIDEADLRRALFAAAGEPDMHLWLRLGAESGLRCIEMAKVNHSEIGPARLKVVGKGNKPRTTVLNKSLRAELLDHPHDADGFLFGRLDNVSGIPSASRVSERINAHLHAAGIEATAHSLRHRFGTEMYRATLDIVKVAALMGHGSLDTTRGYVRLVEAEESTEQAEALTIRSA